MKPLYFHGSSKCVRRCCPKNRFLKIDQGRRPTNSHSHQNLTALPTTVRRSPPGTHRKSALVFRLDSFCCEVGINVASMQQFPLLAENTQKRHKKGNIWLQYHTPRGQKEALQIKASGFASHLTRALTVERTTLESRNSGVTRMWKSDREAKATAGDRSASSET